MDWKKAIYESSENMAQRETSRGIVNRHSDGKAFLFDKTGRMVRKLDSSEVEGYHDWYPLEYSELKE